MDLAMLGLKVRGPVYERGKLPSRGKHKADALLPMRVQHNIPVCWLQHELAQT